MRWFQAAWFLASGLLAGIAIGRLSMLRMLAKLSASWDERLASLREASNERELAMHRIKKMITEGLRDRKHE